MSSPTFPILGGATLNRKWLYEFNLNFGVSDEPEFTMLGGVTNSQFQPDTPNWVSDTDQAGQGNESSTKTGGTWSGDITCSRKVNIDDPTSYDVVQEYLRVHAVGIYGPGNTVEVRVSEYDPSDPTGAASPRVEAYHGFCGVGWVPAGGDMLAEDDVAISLVGQGKLSLIDHPYPATTVPQIDTVTPNVAGTAGGGLVVIKGRGFTGTVPTTGVKFGATNATNWDVVDDSTIVATIPAHASGAVVLVVTNASGASTDGPTVTYS